MEAAMNVAKGHKFRDETAFQQAILDLCRYWGLLAYHTYDSRRSTSGFPDLVIVGPGGCLFRELKMDGKRPTLVQADWLEALTDSGMDAGCWWEHDWPSTVRSQLEDIRHPQEGHRP